MSSEESNQEKDVPRIGVIGSGSWATALVKILCENSEKVGWWVRHEEHIEHIQKFGHNPKYLSAADLQKEKLEMTSDLRTLIKENDILIMVVPSAYIDEVFSELEEGIFEDKILFSSVKGFVKEYDMIPARYFKKKFKIPSKKLGIICGPCHAEEVAMERLSYLTVACKAKSKAEYLANVLACRYIKTQVTEDVIGSEIATAMKNVYAIASGICDGLGYGDNFQAVLISNCIMEMERFLDEVKSVHRDVKSSAYLGDLLVTAYSQFSRNRNFGQMIGKGYTVKSAMLEMNMVAEGYYAAKSLVVMNEKYGARIPIIMSVYRILYEKNAPKVEMYLLTDEVR